MTNCLLSQQKLDEARTVLMKGVALWLPSNTSEQCTVDSKASGSHDQSETVPAYFSRVNTAKLLLELQEFDVCQCVCVCHCLTNCPTPLGSSTNLGRPSP